MLAVWNYTWAPGKTGPWKFLSDGTINGDERVTWSLVKDSIVMKGPDPRLGGGHWIDTCKTSRDGKTMSGTNQLRHRKSAKLAEAR